MLILSAFAALVLLAAGVAAVSHGDTLPMAGILIVLALAALIAAPQLSALMQQLQDTLNTGLPLALR